VDGETFDDIEASGVSHFSRPFERRFRATLVTYADDVVVLCRHGATEVLETTRRWMAGIGLTPNETKTRVCDARCEPFTFLG